jgi:cytochrome c peroxidase
MRSIYLISFLTLALLTSCSEDTQTLGFEPKGLDHQLTHTIEVSGMEIEDLQLGTIDLLASIPQDPKNPLTLAKIRLGSFLFHETGLGLNPNKETGMNTYSCASCHHVDAGFQSGLRQGIGDGGSGFGLAGELRAMALDYTSEDIDKQPIKSPSALNVAYQKLMLWNGQFGATGPNTGTEAQWTPDSPKETNNLGFEGVETQAIAGLKVHRLVIDKNFLDTQGYTQLFDQAFPNTPSEARYTAEKAGLAIAAYERTLLANEAPFQQWLRGYTDAMTEDQKLGALLFFGKGECFSCHHGPALNDMEFHALGLKDLTGNGILGEVDDATKKGRGGFTGNRNDDYKFKTPQLYNLKEARFYGHGASFSSIREIIAYKNNGISENSNVPESALSPLFKPLLLTDAELDLLTTFVSEALNDANLKRYVPISLPTGNCFPNADPASKADMGCD